MVNLDKRCGAKPRDSRVKPASAAILRTVPGVQIYFKQDQLSEPHAFKPLRTSAQTTAPPAMLPFKISPRLFSPLCPPRRCQGLSRPSQPLRQAVSEPEGTRRGGYSSVSRDERVGLAAGGVTGAVRAGIALVVPYRGSVGAEEAVYMSAPLY